MPDREKLIDLIVQGNIMAFGKSESFSETIADHLIANGVTVRERGRWEEYQIPHIKCCSECDWGTDVECNFNFCPNCGADMRPNGEGEEDGK